MSRVQFVVLLLVAAVFSFLGGMFANGGRPWAQAAETPKVVTAKEFRLVDTEGNRQGFMTCTPGGPVWYFGSEKQGSLTLDFIQTGSPRIMISGPKTVNARRQIVLNVEDKASKITMMYGDEARVGVGTHADGSGHILIAGPGKEIKTLLP